MQVGKIKIIDKVIYVYVNYQGTLEKLYRLKWYAQLYLEILQGLNKLMTLEKLRKYCYKYRKRDNYD